MDSIKRLSALLLVCVLLSASLAGAASAGPGGAPVTVTDKTLTVSASACHAWSHSANYVHGRNFIRAVTGPNGFLCPVRFPEYGTHIVQGITMYAYDAHPEDVCADATRTSPSTKSETPMGDVCSSGSSGTNPRSFPMPSISPNSVAPENGMYFWVSMEGTRDLKLYGFRISYRVCHTLITSVGPAAAGTISAEPAPNCTQNTYEPGTVVTLEANAESGWDFTQWSGDASGTVITTTVTMDSLKSVGAHFMCDGCVPRGYLPLVLRSY